MLCYERKDNPLTISKFHYRHITATITAISDIYTDIPIMLCDNFAYLCFLFPWHKVNGSFFIFDLFWYYFAKVIKIS